MNDFLAPIIDNLKARSPRLFLFIQLILMGLLYIINQGADLGVIELTPVIKQIGTWVNYVIILLIGGTGSRTTRYVQISPPGESKQAA